MHEGMSKGAMFSRDRAYRYTLVRQWKPSGAPNMVSFVGLNPSTADETTDDPTVRRCINFAQRWGFDGMYMLNAFAFRATDPEEMKAAASPIGPENNQVIVEYSRVSKLTIICWGNHGAYLDRGHFVKGLINNPFCLGWNKTGEPKHPLYLAKDTPPRPYNERGREKDKQTYKQNWITYRENYIS